MYPAACSTVSPEPDEVTGVARTVSTSGIDDESRRTASATIPRRMTTLMPAIMNRFDHFGSSGSFCERSIRKLCRSPYFVSSAINPLVSQCREDLSSRRMPRGCNSSEQPHRDGEADCSHEYRERDSNTEDSFTEGQRVRSSCRKTIERQHQNQAKGSAQQG